MEQTRNKNGKFAKQYRFETRREYETELRRLERKLENQSEHLKDNADDIKSQADLIAKLQSDVRKCEDENVLMFNTNHELWNIIALAKKFPIVRLAIRLKYGK